METKLGSGTIHRVILDTKYIFQISERDGEFCKQRAKFWSQDSELRRLEIARYLLADFPTKDLSEACYELELKVLATLSGLTVQVLRGEVA